MKTVLLLTRDSALQSVLAESLLVRGAVVLLARNADDGVQIARARSRELDFALIDLADGCNGTALVETLHTAHPGVPMVVATSENDSYGAPFFRQGGDVWLSKPVDTACLKIAIANLMKRRGAAAGVVAPTLARSAAA